jgi:UDPglucose 6-dehydrogenase
MLFSKLNNAFDGDLNGKTIAVWGLAFKPNTDDMREAPSRTLMEAVWAAGGGIQAYDPEARDECRRLYGDRKDLVLAEHRMDALDGADALVICTEWKEFRVVDFEAIKAALHTPVIVDGRNIYEPSAVNAAGLLYFGVGRGDGVTSQPSR